MSEHENCAGAEYKLKLEILELQKALEQERLQNERLVRENAGIQADTLRGLLKASEEQTEDNKNHNERIFNECLKHHEAEREHWARMERLKTVNTPASDDQIATMFDD